MGKLIVIEGACDGIGKSTQTRLLKEELQKEGKLITHHFPSYGEPQAKDVEKYLAGDYGKVGELDPKVVNGFYANDRKETWDKQLKPEYDAGSTILLDRYTTSSLIYQSALMETEEEKKDFIDYVVNYEYSVLGIGKPDLVIFLYADFDLAMRLKKEREDSNQSIADIHEKDLSYMRKVYDNAMFIADYLNWSKVKCDEDDHMRSIEDIHEDVYKLVKKMDK